MKLDEALLHIGGYGKFQCLWYTVIGFVCMRGVWHLLSIFFIGYVTPYSCYVPPSDIYNYSAVSICADKCQCEIDKCYILRINGTDAAKISCPNGWRYDDDWVSRWHFELDYETTIVREWDLVCADNYLVDLSTSIFMAGVLCGALFITPLSDKFGRKNVLIHCLWLQAVFGVSLAFVNNFVEFAVLRFFIGVLNQGIALVGYVYMVEIFPATHRTMPAVGLQIFWSVGIMLLALFAFLLKNWRYLELAISLPCLLFVPLYWVMPESLVWLVNAGKLQTAERILQRAAKFNGCSESLPASCLTGSSASHGAFQKDAGAAPATYTQFKESSAASTGKVSIIAMTMSGSDEKASTTHLAAMDSLNEETSAVGNSSDDDTAFGHEQTKHTALDLFRSPVIRRYTLSMFIIWFVNSMDYLGLSLAISDLHGDKYINFFLSGIVEVPAYISATLLVNRVGRKKPLFSFMILSGLANVMTTFVPLWFNSDCDDMTAKWLTTAIALVGKFGISGSFCIVFLFASEIFPTSVRGVGVGLCSFWDTLGGIIAPQINYSAYMIPWLPRALFGSCAIIGAMFVLILPETHNRKLPNDVNEVEAWAKEKSCCTL